MAQIRIPSMLRYLTGEQEVVRVPAGTVREVLAALEREYPDSTETLFDKRHGDRTILVRFVNLYKGDDDIRFLEGLDTPVGEEDELSIIPAIAGGAARAHTTIYSCQQL